LILGEREEDEMPMTAILGASGPTGIYLATALRRAGATVRVAARTTAKLERLFPDAAVQKLAADIFNPDDTLRAIEGCDLVYDCIGLPGDQMRLHPLTARNIAYALQRTKARCVQISSFWAYFPQVRAVMDESHPRTGGPPWVRYRREAEDILFAQGAAILHLPDFYGPQVHVSTLQNALNEALGGKSMNWLGAAEVPRDYVYVADAMRVAAEIGRREEAFGAHWCLPGGGPLTGRQVADIVSRHLHRTVKLREAGLWMLRLVSLFNRDLRGFMQVAPDYMKPVSYDARKLEGLLGRQEMTGYDSGIGETLKWIAAGRD
jgi:nucleoside-diphosphate-sugar epimerase